MYTPRFQHLYQIHPDGNRHPFMTLCTVRHPDDTIGFGLSVCSPHDTYRKDRGRKIALDRAMNPKENPDSTFILFEDQARKLCGALNLVFGVRPAEDWYAFEVLLRILDSRVPQNVYLWLARALAR